MKVHYIDSDNALRGVVLDIQEEGEIGLDLEFDRNSFGYGFVLCLIQISTENDIYLIDPVNINELKSLWEVFENNRVIKVIHNASEDILLLKKNGCNPINIWDTEKAAMILNKEKTGLSNLLDEYFEQNLDKGVQRTNWRHRPLKKEQLDYAAKDVEFLLPLKQKLQLEVSQSNKEDWIIQEGMFLERLEMKENPYPFLKYKDARRLENEEKRRLAALYSLRERLAESLDLPPYKIMRNELLVTNSKISLEFESEWLKMKGAHPQLKSKEAYNRFNKDLTEENDVPVEKKKKRNNQKTEEALKQIRNRVQENYGGQCTKLIISQAVINDILDSGSTWELKPYVREILFETADDMGIDIKFLK